MANLTIYRTPLTSGFIGTVTIYNATQIQIVAGSVTQNYYGTGFSYSQQGQVTGGTLLSTDLYDSNNGGLQYQLTGLNHSAVTVFNLVSGGGGGLNQFLLGGDDLITGSGDIDSLVGYDGADSISGGAGNDTLDGAQDGRADTLSGGSGDDSYIVDGNSAGSNDLIIEYAGGGIDTVHSWYSHVLAAELENLLLVGEVDASGTGNALDNFIQGHLGANRLDGGAGNDTLDGLGGADTLIGGSGNDVFLVDTQQDSVIELAGGGTDLVQSSASFTLPPEVENLTLTGDQALDGSGNSLANRITGNGAANLLDGGGGADTLVGGDGDDSYVADALDSIIDSAGRDTVIALTDGYVLVAPDIENLQLGGNAHSGSGNAFDNMLSGNALDNTLSGNGGNDTLSGGAGVDTLRGGSGDDLYLVDSNTDVLVELAAGGIDTVRSSTTWTLPAEIENLELVPGVMALDGSGNALPNRISGNDGDNRLDGGAGADTLVGGNGSDSYVLDNSGDLVLESGFQGTDIVLSGVSYSLADAPEVEHLTLTGSAAIEGSGNALNNTITGNAGDNTLRAFGGGDQLFGGAGRDHLFGSDSMDRLDGGSGADTMEGGLGFDQYTVDDAADLIIEVPVNTSDYLDLVYSWVSYTLPQYVEDLTLLGDQPINGTGNPSGGGTLTGNSAANVLSGASFMFGMDGNDTLVAGPYSNLFGGPGNDSYVVNGNQRITELPGEGVDTVLASSGYSYTLDNQLENLTLLTGQWAQGNGQDNLIIGNAGDNYLDGGAGADTLQGGDGNDVYTVDNAGDVVLEAAHAGVDRVQVLTNISYSLAGTEVELLSFHGDGTPAGITGTGNALDNTITAYGSGPSTLHGAAGDDTLYGGLDANQLFGDADNDQLFGGNGADQLDGGDGADQLDGEEGNDTLSGGAGNDTLLAGRDNDSLDGGAGDDQLDMAHYTNYNTGTLGQAVATGGSGADQFLFGAAGSYSNYNLSVAGSGYSPVGRPDRITDFNAAEGDRIVTTITDGQGGVYTTKALVWYGGAGAGFHAALGQSVALAGSGGSDDRFMGVWTLYEPLANLSVLYLDRDLDGLVSSNDLRLEFDGNLALGPGSFSAGTFKLQSGTGLADTNTGSPLGVHDDYAFGLAGNDTLDGLGGNDSISGDDGRDAVRGGADDDRVFGGADNDLVNGDAGDDSLYGGTGADTLDGGEGNDEIWADGFQDATGYARAYVDDGALVANLLSGGAGDDFLLGAAGADTLLGQADDDVLAAGDGADSLDGGDGSDALDGGAGADTVLGGAGADTLSGGPGGSGAGAVVDLLDAGAGDDSIVFDRYGGVAQARGGSGADLFSFAAPFADATGSGVSSVFAPDRIMDFNPVEGDRIGMGLVNGQAGNGSTPVLWRGQAALGFNATLGQSMSAAGPGAAPAGFFEVWTFYTPATDRTTLFMDRNRDGAVDGNDLRIELQGDIALDAASFTAGSFAAAGTAGPDTAATLPGTPGNDVLYGLQGNDSLDGLAGDDSIFGNQGEDALQGGAGTDTLFGGSGNDLLQGGDSADQLLGGSGNDTLDGADGNDALYAATVNDSRFDAVLDAAGSTNLLQGGIGGDTLVGDAGNDTLDGGTDSDELYGRAGRDLLLGASGGDTLGGGGGDDTLDGGAGVDLLAGDDGNDRLGYDPADSTVDGGSGSDLLVLLAPALVDLANSTDQVAGGGSAVNFEGVDFSALAQGVLFDADGQDNLLIGTGLDDQLSGLAGNDTLNGGAGNDTLAGGAGADRYAYGAGDNGIDAIADFGDGDLILVAGASMVSPPLAGDGSALAQNRVQLLGGDGHTTLSIGIDATPGADLRIVLQGVFAAGRLYAFGGEIGFNHGPGGSVTLGASGTAAPGQPLTAGNSLVDADGIGAISYQWLLGAEPISGATAPSFTPDASQLDQLLSVRASYLDGHGSPESVESVPVRISLGKDLAVMAYSWKAHTLLEDVGIQGGAYSGSTDAAGTRLFTAVPGTSLALSASLAVAPAQAGAIAGAVNLQDAIAILRMIVGLEVNGANRPLSPYQALAADFDGNGSVGLTDAIGVLRHVVGLAAPAPAWHFANEIDPAVLGKPVLSPGLPPAINADLGTSSPVHMGLVGYLSGDVDGSYAGANGASDLDASEPGYFSTLVGAHPQLSLSQFGIYA